MKKWEHFPHMADAGIRGFGGSVSEAFEMGAVALTAVITGPETVNDAMSVEIKCEAPDYEFLFYEWINALIYEMEVRNMIFCRYEVSIRSLHNMRLKAAAFGEALDQKKHRPAVILKGATMTELRVEKRNKVWIAQCVVDV